MANEEKYNLTMPASEIDAALIAAKSAVTHEPQTLTEEQKAQARENIGVGSGGGAKVVDLSKYTTADGTTFEEAIQNIILSGEHLGSVEADLTQFFEDAATDGALILKLNVIMADIFIHGVTSCCNMYDGVPEQMSFMCWVDMGMGLTTVIVLFDAFTCDGRISVIGGDPLG